MMSQGGDIPRQPPPKAPQLALGDSWWKGSLGVQVMEADDHVQWKCYSM